MKKIILLFICLLNVLPLIYADKIIMQDGKEIECKILKEKKDTTIIRTNYGRYVLENKFIQKIFYDSPLEMSSKNNMEFDRRINNKFSNVNFLNKANNLHFQNYKLNLGVGIGFIIPGALLTVVMPGAFNPGLVTIIGPMYFAYFVPLLCTGIVFDVIAIVAFVKANKSYKKWQQQLKDYSLTLSVNGAGNAELAFGYKFN